MPIYPRIRVAAGCATVVFAAACAGSYAYPANAPARAAADVPARFVLQGTDAAAAPDTLPGNACLSPMVDPRDGTEVRIHSAHGGRIGDYRVPSGRYGVGAGEVLRLNCNTGEVIGIVPARG